MSNSHHPHRPRYSKDLAKVSVEAMEGELTHAIIGAAIEVHRALGPGLLEAAYEVSLEHELVQRGLRVRRQVGMPVQYKGVSLDAGYRLDLLVEDTVVVEVKAVDGLTRVHEAQLLTYLRLSGVRIGLLINFNERVLKDGVLRRVM
jgi:GxxExxY protein